MRVMARRSYHRRPFPGMDPYLEGSDRWRDFHSRFLTAVGDALLDRLPNGYDARVEDDATIIGPEPGEPDRIVADAAVVEARFDGNGSAWAGESGNGTATATLAPTAVVAAPDLSRPAKHVAIRLREGNRVVTVIELLSPANKTDDGRQKMTRKREAILRRGANWVEIDLLTRGRRITLDGPLPPGDQYAAILRAAATWRAEIFAWGVLDRPPKVPVPLAGGDDLPLDLGELLDRVLDRGRYARGLRYEGPPDVDLSEDVKADLERIAALPAAEAA